MLGTLDLSGIERLDFMWGFKCHCDREGKHAALSSQYWKVNDREVVG